MQLIIMRHGEAGWHREDRQRTLTDPGRKGVVRTARQLLDAGWKPDRIWCSTLVRARETARIVGGVMTLSPLQQTFLTPDEDPLLCLDALQQEPASGCLMVVSHMPLVGRLTRLLVDGRDQGMPFLTAQAVCLEMDFPGSGCAFFKGSFAP